MSLVLLAAVLGSFALGMVRISFSPAFIAELQQIPSLGKLPAACVSGGIASYSGLALAGGGDPTINSACLTQIRDAGQANLGVQPLALLALAAVLAAGAVCAWAPRLRRLATAALCLVAGALLVVSAVDLARVFAAHFTPGSDTIASGPDLGLWVAAGLLLLVVLAQLGSAGLEWARRALAPLEPPGGTAAR
ncbi:MAG: hypothetical protein ACLQT7_01275 [Candidatus Dormibacteria bacterium]